MFELIKLEECIRNDHHGMEYTIKASKDTGKITGWRAGSRQQVLDYLEKNIIRMNINFSGVATWGTRVTQSKR